MQKHWLLTGEVQTTTSEISQAAVLLSSHVPKEGVASTGCSLTTLCEFWDLELRADASS